MFFRNIENMEQLKKEYKRLAFIYHPDKGGNTADMQALNNEFDALFNKFKTGQTNDTTKKEITEEFKEIINAIINLDGIEIEICGNWIWLSGDTKQHKDKLKESGCYWANKKQMWYWRPEEYAIKGKSNMSIDQIRDKYGSERINPFFRPALA